MKDADPARKGGKQKLKEIFRILVGPAIMVGKALELIGSSGGVLAPCSFIGSTIRVSPI